MCEGGKQVSALFVHLFLQLSIHLVCGVSAQIKGQQALCWLCVTPVTLSSKTGWLFVGNRRGKKSCCTVAFLLSNMATFVQMTLPPQLSTSPISSSSSCNMRYQSTWTLFFSLDKNKMTSAGLVLIPSLSLSLFPPPFHSIFPPSGRLQQQMAAAYSFTPLCITYFEVSAPQVISGCHNWPPNLHRKK